MLSGKLFPNTIWPNGGVSGHRHKLRHSNSGRETKQNKTKQEVETTYNRAFLTPLFVLIKTLRDI